MDLNEIVVFARVVQAGSFTKAAVDLRMPKSTVSRICQRIREMVDKNGLTVISVSHGDAWRAIADHVFKLVDAKLVAVDPAASADIVPLGKPGPALSA